jgi:hypothetical protein
MVHDAFRFAAVIFRFGNNKVGARSQKSRTLSDLVQSSFMLGISAKVVGW